MNIRFRIILDDDAHMEGDAPEITHRLESGEITAYGVILEQMCNMGDWHSVDSLWSCLVESSDEIGIYLASCDIRNEHLREVANQLTPQAQHGAILDGYGCLCPDCES